MAVSLLQFQDLLACKSNFKNGLELTFQFCSNVNVYDLEKIFCFLDLCN
jgi:hypothetical protein